MTERIEQLAQQAGFFGCMDEGAGLVFRRFVELIVRECAAMAEGFEFAVERDGLSKAMREHFGVEE